MGVKMFGVLLACVWLVAGSPLHPWPLIPHKAITHGSYIRHYTAAWYDTAALREHRTRSRRDTSASGHPGDATLNLRLHALDRVFKMRLTRDTSLFHEDVVFEGSNGREIAFDPLHAYSGIVDEDENSSVHGIVTEEGLFDGTIFTASDEIYIEPASRYAPLVCHRQDGEHQDTTDTMHHHTIAYRSMDVNVSHHSGYPCASELLRENSLNELRTNRTWSGYLGDTMRPFYQHLNEGKSRAKPGFYPKDARKKDPMASSHNLELLDKLYRERYSRVLRKRTSVDPKKTTCMLYLQADHTFFDHYKSEEACIEVMTRHVQRVNSIYRYTDFNQDGQPDNISFMIKRVKVHGEGALNDPTYRFTGTYGVEEFLELFSEPQNAICGNGVVEDGEECDCGWEEDCNDPCCHPQRLHHAPHEIPCRLADGAVCSPSQSVRALYTAFSTDAVAHPALLQGPCCTSGCTLRNGDKCRDDNGCRDASFCDGRGPQCPPSINKPNKTICNEEFVCYMGECTGSICLAYGLESCQCIAGPEDPPTKSCELCCKLPGEDQPCLSSFAWNSAPYDIPDMLSKPGTPCNDYNGYCDVFQRCREVDPSGPLATLRRLLLSDASLASFQRWLVDRWYILAFIVFMLLLTLMFVVRLVKKRRNRSKITMESQPKATNEESKESVRKLRSMDISRLKRRLLETMKSIASPRRKKEGYSRDSLFSRISRLMVNDSGVPSEKQSNEGEKLYKNNEQTKHEDASKQKVETSLVSRKETNWRRFSLPWVGDRGSSSTTGRRKLDNDKSTSAQTWKKSVQVDKLCKTSKTVVNPRRKGDRYQTEPLVVPDTPDTPGDILETRIQTSDLTVLLDDS
ncbi:disintegrin and metalloproteinase domain-containing protein 10 isoform X4 [Megachile rotundata]|uniref:disintegrin and metalloproteinase domain-containing protein 10 isoform X4 n=1 Tax=Megachile rotundata TaxID=143995 RepID=UPI003FCF60A1